MRRPLAPLRTTAALALSLSLALTACGSDDAEPDAAKEDTSSAPDTTGPEDEAAESEPSEDADGEDETSPEETEPSAPSSTKNAGDDLTPEEFATLLATAMERGRTARIGMSGSGLAGTSMEGVVDYTRREPAMRMKMSGGDDQGGLQTEMIMVDGAVYMQMGQEDQYIKMDTSAAGADIGRMDPGANLSNFSAGISELTLVGEEKVGGETTHHYLAVIDTSKLTQDNPVAGADAKKLDYHVWLGTDNLVRKFSLDAGDGLGAMEMTFSDWGKPVDVKAPPKDKVTEMPALPSSPNS